MVEIVVSSAFCDGSASAFRLSKQGTRKAAIWQCQTDTSVYPFRIVTNLHDFNSTEACVTYVVQSPVQCGPGQIAPPLMMLLSSACKHNRSEAPPPSSLDVWGCWLISKIIVDCFHPDCYVIPSIVDETILPNNCCCFVSSCLILSRHSCLDPEDQSTWFK